MENKEERIETPPIDTTGLDLLAEVAELEAVKMELEAEKQRAFELAERQGPRGLLNLAG